MIKKYTGSSLKRRSAIRARSFGAWLLHVDQARSPLRSDAAQRRHCSIYIAAARRNGWLAFELK